MITTTIQHDEYSHSHRSNLTFPIDEEAMMEKISEIGINDSNIDNCHVVKISGKVPALYFK